MTEKDNNHRDPPEDGQPTTTSTANEETTSGVSSAIDQPAHPRRSPRLQPGTLIPASTRVDPLTLLPEPGTDEANELYALPSFSGTARSTSALVYADEEPPSATDGHELPPSYAAGVHTRFPTPGDQGPEPVSYDPDKVRPRIDKWILAHSILRAATFVCELITATCVLYAWTQSTAPIPGVYQTRLGLAAASPLIDAFFSLLFSNPFPVKHAVYQRSYKIPARVHRMHIYSVIFALFGVAVAVCIPPCWVSADGIPLELPNGRFRVNFVADSGNTWVSSEGTFWSLIDSLC